MPRLTNKKLAARAVVTVVKKAKRKLKPAQPSTARLDAAFKRATSV